MWLELTTDENIIVNMSNVQYIDYCIIPEYKSTLWYTDGKILNVKETKEQILKMIREYE